jgi:hypothetical protein
VTRAAVFVLAVGALVASGWTFWRHHYQLNQGGQVALLSGAKLTEYELQSAAHTMAEAKAETGTFEMTDLRQYRNLAVVFANDRAYCLQVGVGPDAMHYPGPAGPVTVGSC